MSEVPGPGAYDVLPALEKTPGAAPEKPDRQMVGCLESGGHEDKMSSAAKEDHLRFSGLPSCYAASVQPH